MLDKTAQGALCPTGDIMSMRKWVAARKKGKRPTHSVELCQAYENGMVVITAIVPSEAAQAILYFLGSI